MARKVATVTARQQIPNRIMTDEDGVEHVEVAFLALLQHLWLISSSISGYGFQSHENRIWTDEDGVGHVEGAFLSIATTFVAYILNYFWLWIPKS